MDDDGVSGVGKFFRTIPDLLNKGTRSVVLLHLHASLVKAFFYFQGSAKCGYDHDIVGKDFFPGNELSPVSVHDELDTPVAQVVVYFRVVNHLTEEEHPASGIFVKRAVADFNGVFHAVAKSEMACEVKGYGTKIQTAGAKILLPGIPHSSNLLNPACDG